MPGQVDIFLDLNKELEKKNTVNDKNKKLVNSIVLRNADHQEAEFTRTSEAELLLSSQD